MTATEWSGAGPVDLACVRWTHAHPHRPGRPRRLDRLRDAGARPRRAVATRRAGRTARLSRGAPARRGVRRPRP
ncbi:hypothetical protein PLANTIT3_60563 [Plantibacter sp. T3]|nr:hypothetical protein PLANTIT3_60563 [Plantibacter sp. T3]